MEFKWICPVCGTDLTRVAKEYSRPAWTRNSRMKTERDLLWDAINHLASHIV